MSIKTIEPPFKVDNANDFSSALTKLNDKIDEVKKNITYLDIYNITSVVTNKERLVSQINALAPNSSLVINTDPFYLNGVSYNTGDIILKLADGNTVHVNAQPGGIYYPSKITADKKGNYSLEYAYDTTAPTIENSSAAIGQDVTQAKTITFNGLTESTTATVYGLWQEFKDGYFDINSKEDGTIIQPYIKFYFVDNNKKPLEEIVLDYSLTDDGSNWIITDVPDALKNILYIKVK